MLSPEHVRVRRQGKELKLLSLSGELRERALLLSGLVIAAARAAVGETREDLIAAWSAIDVAPRERRIFLGLGKLVEESCEFELPDGGASEELRRELFSAAHAARREDRFDRAGLLAEVASARGTDAAGVEAALYADLRGAHRLLFVNAPEPETLLARYERAQVQAILLRAVRVVCTVRCASADRYRELFRKLKFRRLMHRVTALPDGGYELEIDGPFSLFQSVQKYGLELALMLPALEACERLELSADVRWTERSGVLVFRHRAGGADAGGASVVGDEVRDLVVELSQPGTGWTATPSERILDLPGIGVCVPDIRLTRLDDGAEVLLEILGFWSRSSVWRRVELAERGLGSKVIFAVNARLRVSEDVLDDEAGASLYVYKSRIAPKALLRRAEALLAAPTAKKANRKSQKEP